MALGEKKEIVIHLSSFYPSYGRAKIAAPVHPLYPHPTLLLLLPPVRDSGVTRNRGEIKHMHSSLPIQKGWEGAERGKRRVLLFFYLFLPKGG